MALPVQPAAIVSVVTFVALIGLVLRRMVRGRKMRLEALWVRPAIIVAIAAFVVFNAPPHGAIEIAVLVGAAAVGALPGWYQGKRMAISIEPDTHLLNVKASPVAVIVFLSFIAARIALRPVLMDEAASRHIDLGLISDALILLIAGFYCAQFAEMYVRARALLVEARQQRAPDELA